jgi:hypothetical protein
MNRPIFLAVGVALVPLLGITATADELCFKDKLVGGASEIQPESGVIYSLSANAIRTPRKLVGHIQYSLDNDQTGTPLLYVHSAVDCAGWATTGDGTHTVIAIEGAASVQENAEGMATDDRVVVAIKDLGTGMGDQVFFSFATAETEGDFCANPAGVLDDNDNLPDVVLEGEFKIRLAPECTTPPGRPADPGSPARHDEEPDSEDAAGPPPWAANGRGPVNANGKANAYGVRGKQAGPE